MKLFTSKGELTQMVFEVRFEGGYSILDKRGSLIDRILGEYPDWFIQPNVNPYQAPLWNRSTRTRLNLEPTKFDFMLQGTTVEPGILEADIEDFGADARAISSLIESFLGIREFTRIGCRLWYLFPFESEREVEKHVAGLLGLGNVRNTVSETLGGIVGAMSATFVSTLEKKPKRLARLSINGVNKPEQIDLGGANLQLKDGERVRDRNERARKLHRERKRILTERVHGLMFDVDHSIEEPRELNASVFIDQTLELSEHTIESIVAKAESPKGSRAK